LWPAPLRALCRRQAAIIVQLTELVEVSQRVAATSSRLEKIAALRSCLQRMPPAEIAIGIRFLSGETRQDKLGVGPAAIFQARGAAIDDSRASENLRRRHSP